MNSLVFKFRILEVDVLFFQCFLLSDKIRSFLRKPVELVSVEFNVNNPISQS